MSIYFLYNPLMPIITLLLAALAVFIVGTIRYSPVLFGTTYMNLVCAGKKKQAAKPSLAKMLPLFVGQYVLSLVLTFVTYVFLTYGGAVSYQDAIVTALLLWVWYQLTSTLGNALWEQRSWKYYAITGGMELVGLLVAVVVIVAMS